MTEFCFDYKLEWVKVCLRLRMRSVSRDVAVVGISDCFLIGEY